MTGCDTCRFNKKSYEESPCDDCTFGNSYYSACITREEAIALLNNLRAFAEDDDEPAIDMAIEALRTKMEDEKELKFYYVESIDDYWIGRRVDNFYYANWHNGLGFIWSHSRYLPWGEHIVDENTLWKEHTYPSEPIEIPFTEWIVGFVKKYFAEPNREEGEE